MAAGRANFAGYMLANTTGRTRKKSHISTVCPKKCSFNEN